MKLKPDPASVLVTAVVAVFPSWLIGAEQFLPPLIIVAGLLLMLLRGARLWVPLAGWALLGFIAVTLLSIGSLTGSAAMMIYLKGLLNLCFGLAAFLVAANLYSSEAGVRRVVTHVTVQSVLLAVVGVAFFLDWLPPRFDALLPVRPPDFLMASSFVADHLMIRNIGSLPRIDLAITYPRFSGVYLYNTGLGSAAIVMMGFALAGSALFEASWRRWLSITGVLAGLGCAVLSGSRTAIVLAFGLLAGWILLRVIQRAGLLNTMAVCLAVAALILGLLIVWSVDVGNTTTAAFAEHRLESFLGRIEMYSASIAALRDHAVFGFGVQELASQSAETELRLGTHSELLNVTYRFGALGLLSYCAVGLAFLVTIWEWLRVVPLDPRTDRRVVAALALILAAFVTAANGMAHILQWDATLYWALWCLVGLVHALLRSATAGVDSPGVAA